MLSLKNEFYRKLIHLLSIFFPIIYNYYEVYFYFIMILSTVLITTIDIFRKYDNIISSIFKKILGNVVRDYEQNALMGATYMLLSFTLISLIFPKDIVIVSMIILSISDSLAAIFGIVYGKTLLLNSKTLEGSFIFMISTLFILSFYYLSLFKLFASSLIVTITEHLSISKYDNFTIPIISSTILYILWVLYLQYFFGFYLLFQFLLFFIY